MAFKFIGWCCETDSKGAKHDKIWGYFDNGDPVPPKNRWEDPVQHVYIFWGGREKKNTIKFKADVEGYELQKKVSEKKHKKHYQAINEAQLLKIWPTFHTDVEMKLCFDVLANRVMPR